MIPEQNMKNQQGLPYLSLIVESNPGQTLRDIRDGGGRPDSTHVFGAVIKHSKNVVKQTNKQKIIHVI